MNFCSSSKCQFLNVNWYHFDESTDIDSFYQRNTVLILIDSFSETYCITLLAQHTNPYIVDKYCSLIKTNTIKVAEVAMLWDARICQPLLSFGVSIFETEGLTLGFLALFTSCSNAVGLRTEIPPRLVSALTYLSSPLPPFPAGVWGGFRAVGFPTHLYPGLRGRRLAGAAAARLYASHRLAYRLAPFGVSLILYPVWFVVVRA